LVIILQYISMIMKLLTLPIIIFILLSFNFFPNAYGNDKKLLIVGEEFPPFEFIQNNKIVGIDIDIISHILTKMDIPFEFQIIPWKRAWSMVEKGSADAVLSTSRKETRYSYVIYPEEDVWMSEFVFFVKKDKRISNFDGYQTAINKHLKIGIVSGNSYHPSFWKAFPYKNGATTFQGDSVSGAMLNSHLDLGTTVEINIKKLVGGRFDIFPCDKIIGMYTAKLLGVQDKLTYYDRVLFSKGYPIPFVKKSSFPNIQKIAIQFEKELKLFKKSNEYQIIMDRWLK